MQVFLVSAVHELYHVPDRRIQENKNMINTQESQNSNMFYPGEQVIWHHKDKNRIIPVPGVVLRQETDGIVIKACFQGSVQELKVDLDQLVAR
jgi:ribosomal protein L35AE/L33A